MRALLVVGSAFAAISVLFGAFGAHILKSRLSIEDLTIFETAVRYQMYDSLGIMILGGAFLYIPHNLIYLHSYFIIFGTIIFSGTLYLIVFTNLSWMGAITPVGGLCLILGWLIFAYNIYRS